MESNGMNRSVETLSELVLLLREKRVEIFERICGRHWLNTTKFQCYDASAGAPIAVNVIFQSAHNQPSRRNRPRRSNYLDNPEECKKLRCSSRSNEEQATMAKKRIRRSMSQKGDNMFILVSPANPNLLMNFQLIYNELDNIMNVFIKQAEADVAALNRRIQLLEEDLGRAEERLKIATERLEEASKAADESERVRKALENRFEMEDDRSSQLDMKLRQTMGMLQEMENKYEEVARKLAIVEAELERAEERAEAGENKIVELEEELRVVGNNLKSLEVSEEKALQREDSYEEQIRVLSQRLKEAETRAEFAERSVQKLQKEVDRLEDDVTSQRATTQALYEAIQEAAAQ